MGSAEVCLCAKWAFQAEHPMPQTMVCPFAPGALVPAEAEVAPAGTGEPVGAPVLVSMGPPGLDLPTGW